MLGHVQSQTFGPLLILLLAAPLKQLILLINYFKKYI